MFRIDTYKIKLILAERGETQTTLAKKSGISRQSISTILTRGTCTPVSAGKLAKGLNVTPAEIVLEN